MTHGTRVFLGRRTTSCPSGEAGVCETPAVSGIATYIYYHYDTATASAEKLGCQTVGGTWH